MAHVSVIGSARSFVNPLEESYLRLAQVADSGVERYTLAAAFSSAAGAQQKDR